MIDSIVLEAHHVVSVSVRALRDHQSRHSPGVSSTRGVEPSLETVNLKIILREGEPHNMCCHLCLSAGWPVDDLVLKNVVRGLDSPGEDVAVHLTAPAVSRQDRPGWSSSHHHGSALPLVQRVAGLAVVIAVVLQPHLVDGQLIGVSYLLCVKPLSLYQLHGLLVPEHLGQHTHVGGGGGGGVSVGTHPGGRVGVDSADQGEALPLPTVHPLTLNLNLWRV